MLDESEFLSDYGVRALSRHHREHPYTLDWNGQHSRSTIKPGESTSGLVWREFELARPDLDAVNYLIIESLSRSSTTLTRRLSPCESNGIRPLPHHRDVAGELATRLTRIFLRTRMAKRSRVRGSARLQDDPHFRTTCCFTSTSTATVAAASARRIKRAGPDCGQTPPAGRAPIGKHRNTGVRAIERGIQPL